MYDKFVKKLSLLLIIFSIYSVGLCVYAEDTVYLDVNLPDIKNYDTGDLKFGNNKHTYNEDDENYLKPSLYSIKKMFDEDFRSQKNKSNKK